MSPTKPKPEDGLSVNEAYLTFTVAGKYFALPCHKLIQIVDSPSVTYVPKMPEHVRGVIDFQGESIPLVDARVAMGFCLLTEEIEEHVATLVLRKQDHLQWIEELKCAVAEEQKITLETDPHRCAFGKWYDAFTPQTRTLARYMAKFDTPHKLIHDLAVKAKTLISQGKKEEAKKMIKKAENSELRFLIKLFDGFEQQVKTFTHEYALVVVQSGQKIALAVDTVNHFDQLDSIEQEVPSLFAATKNNFIEGIGRKETGNDEESEILILNFNKLLDHSAGVEEMGL